MSSALPPEQPEEPGRRPDDAGQQYGQGSPPYAQGPYAQGPYGGSYPPQPSGGTNGLAVASLVLGIIWLYWIGSILALVFGYVARRQIRERGQTGDGLAVAGIVLSWIGVAVLAAVVVIGIGVAVTGSS